MRRLVLTPYLFSGADYSVKESAAGILFAPHLKLGARDAINNDRIARMIEGAEDAILLEEADYQTLRRAVETFEGYARQDLEFVARVLDAPEVGVKEA